MTDVTVTHNPQQNRYDAHIDGELAGFAEYEADESVITFTHTRVDDAFGGKGVGSALAQFALDDVKAQGNRRVRPQCPFIKGWIDKHPAYAELL